MCRSFPTILANIYSLTITDCLLIITLLLMDMMCTNLLPCSNTIIVTTRLVGCTLIKAHHIETGFSAPWVHVDHWASSIYTNQIIFSLCSLHEKSRDKLQPSIYLSIHMSLGSGRELERLSKTHAITDRMCKFHTDNTKGRHWFHWCLTKQL